VAPAAAAAIAATDRLDDSIRLFWRSVPVTLRLFLASKFDANRAVANGEGG
jgi:hypothetical protein